MYKLESKTWKGLDWQLKKTQAITGTSQGTSGVTGVYHTHTQYPGGYDKVILH